MYKNEGLLLYVIAVLYFVLLRFLWSQTSNIFYERLFFFFYPLSLTLHPESHYLCAKRNENEQNWKKKCSKKKKRKMTSSDRFKFFYFCMNCREKEIVPFHQCQQFVVCVDFDIGGEATLSIF